MYLKKFLKRKALNWLTKHLLNTITEEDVLRGDKNNGILYKGKRLSNEMVDQLEVDAEHLKNSLALKLLLDDMRFLANQTMYEKSTTYDDLLFGKAMLFVIDVLKKKINTLAK